jgi:non-heme chloroperoxidase
LVIELQVCGRRLLYRQVRVTTPDGVAISAQDHAVDARPSDRRDVLFIHGFCQSSLSWLNQVTGPLRQRHRLVTYDMRGHGGSAKPQSQHYYGNSERWADEVAAVISALDLKRPVIVCWSYAGRVALDYLSRYGDGAVSGLVMVAATSTLNDTVFGPARATLKQMATSEGAAYVVAARALLSECTYTQLPPDETALMLSYNLLAPIEARAAMSSRSAAYDDTLQGLNIPVLAVHGEEDRINTIAMSRHTRALCKKAHLSLYPRTGHLPFWEQAERFDAELGAFLDTLD